MIYGVEHIDLWKVYERKIPGEAVCITTSGCVNAYGANTMGRGTAAQAARRFEGLPLWLGTRLTRYGNRVYYFPAIHLITFPVKPVQGRQEDLLPRPRLAHRFRGVPSVPGWACMASLRIINRSLAELCKLRLALGLERVYLPMPGCGAGGLDWVEDGVYEACSRHLWLVVVDRPQ